MIPGVALRFARIANPPLYPFKPAFYTFSKFFSIKFFAAQVSFVIHAYGSESPIGMDRGMHREGVW